MSELETAAVVLTSYADVKEALGNVDLTRNIDSERYCRGNILENVIMMLDGAHHRDRRRAENMLFRRDALTRFELDVLPRTIDDLVESLIEDGESDLIEIGSTVALTISAAIAGLDVDAHSPGQLAKLRRLTHRISRGAAIDGATGDLEAIKADVRDALSALRAGYFEPSMESRRDRNRSSASGGELGDVLSILMHNQEALDLADDDLLRETAFFLEAGSNTSAQALASAFHFLFGDVAVTGDDVHVPDRAHIQRCVQEALRLRPTNPAIKRRAQRATSVAGRALAKGQHLLLDVGSANRDRAAFGLDADDFNANRIVPGSVNRYGLSFGGGIHACIGRVLAVGLPPKGPQAPESPDHLYGMVTLLAESLLAHGVIPHPQKAPEAESQTIRWTRWAHYPVAFRQPRTTGAQLDWPSRPRRCLATTSKPRLSI